MVADNLLVPSDVKRMCTGAKPLFVRLCGTALTRLLAAKPVVALKVKAFGKY